MRFGMENIKLMNKICEKLACLNVFPVSIHISLVVLQQFIIILTKIDVEVEGIIIIEIRKVELRKRKVVSLQFTLLQRTCTFYGETGEIASAFDFCTAWLPMVFRMRYTRLKVRKYCEWTNSLDQSSSSLQSERIAGVFFFSLLTIFVKWNMVTDCTRRIERLSHTTDFCIYTFFDIIICQFIHIFVALGKHWKIINNSAP